VFKSLLRVLGLGKSEPGAQKRDGAEPRNFVYVVELDPQVSKWGWVRKLNPSAREEKGVVEVRLLCGKGLPETHFASGDFTSLRKAKHFKRVIPGMSKGFGRMVEGLEILEKTVTKLRDQGYMVANKPPSTRYRVYVIEVDDSVKNRARVQRMNPKADPALPCVYVGQTSREPEVRLQQHQHGKSWGRDLAGRFMVGHCVMLRPDLVKGIAENMTELESMKAEKELADKLRGQGYTVIGGH
jgi:hypothetical protein